MNEHCTCPVAGWCDRHKKNKGDEQFKRCNGTAGTNDCGLAYWNAWEEGRAGATAPENPVFDPPGFCSNKATTIIVYKSSVGDRLAEIIKRETGKEIPCEACAIEVKQLNSITVAECVVRREATVDSIYSRAFEHATIGQQIAIVADRMATGGAIAKHTIGKWFDEAVETGAEPKQSDASRQPKKQCSSC